MPLLALLLIAIGNAFLKTFVLLPSPLSSDPPGFTFLIYLSPRKPGPDIYLLYEITFSTPTSNSTNSAAPSCISASSLAIPWTHHSDAHSSSKQLFCHSSNPQEGNFSQIIQYRLDSCLDNSSSSPSLHLACACCPGHNIPSEHKLYRAWGDQNSANVCPCVCRKRRLIIGYKLSYTTGSLYAWSSCMQ